MQEYSQGPASDRVQRKKRLLQQRDEILESIGKDVYADGDLPAQFKNLAVDRREFDALIQQLESRIGPMAHDLENHVSRLPELERDLRELDLRRKNAIDPLKRDMDEFSGRDDEAALTCLRNLQQQIQVLKDEFSIQRKIVKNEIESHEKRAEALRSEIQKIKDEEEQLNQKWHKSLRDLGHFYYDQHHHENLFTTRYGQLDLLQQELTALRQIPDKSHAPPEPHKSKQRTWKNGLYFGALALLVVFVLFQFRTRFRKIPMPIGVLVQLAEKENAPTIAYEANVADAVLKDWLTDASVVPGIEAFGDELMSSVHSWFLARDANDTLRYLAVSLKHSPPVFERLASKSWTPLPNDDTLQVLTDGLWCWVSFGQDAYGLFPKSVWQSLEIRKDASSPSGWRFKTSIPAYDANHPILAGIDQVDLSGKADGSATCILRSSQQMPDLEARQEMAMHAHELELAFGPDSIEFAVPNMSASRIKGESVLADEIVKLMQPIQQRTIPDQQPLSQPVLRSFDEDKVAQVSRGSRQVLLAMDPSSEALTVLAGTRVGEHLTDLTVLKSGDVILVDRAQRSVMKLVLMGGAFHVLQTLSLASIEGVAPIRVVPSGDETKILVLLEPLDQGRGALVLLDSSNLTELWRQNMPADTERPLCAMWHGDTFYLGVRANRSSGTLARSVLAYRLEGSQLVLSHLMDMSASSKGYVRVPSIQISTVRQSIVAYNTSDASLARYALNESNSRIQDQTELTQVNIFTSSQRPILHDDPGALNLSRNQHQLVVADVSDYSTKDYGTRLFLVDLDADRPIMIDEENLGGMIFGVVRQPLSDRLFVTMNQDRSLARLTIKGRSFEDVERFTFEKLAPQRLCFSRFGEVMYVTGLLRD